MHGYSSETQKLIALLYEEECRKPRKQSPEQKEAGKRNIEKRREEGGGFDQMPDSEHERLSRKGGESERKKKPLCDGEG